ncbi:MAG TPA: HAD family hydrolase [Acidobacteriota bacterium]|nr:HAD family hydrolase [Acidobacteriota bacterium]
MRKAIFIDRDGTLIEEVGYLKMIEDLRFTTRATQALRIFHELGFLNIVMTNQSAIARGILSEKELKKIHQRLKILAEEDGAPVDDIFYCPHFAGGRMAPHNVECECRKPKPGMIVHAREKHHLDLQQCYVVGDKPSDMELARNAGVAGVLVLTGFGAQTREQIDPAIAAFENLYEFAMDLKRRFNAEGAELG